MATREWQDRLGRQVKLRELRVLLAVAEQGSFRKAARQLHLTQPAVTAAIAELEHTLGVRLFVRTSRGVTPTAHGESFVPRATAIFGELVRAAEDIEVVSRGSRQTLRVGAGGGGWGQGILPAALAKLLDPQPDAFILIREADEDVLLELLKARKLKASDPAKDRCLLEVADAKLVPVAGVRPYVDLKVGESVYTLGTPSGLDLTLGNGILSALREDEGMRYVQTTAPISPGSSGGGLFDARGNLVGITTLVFVGKERLNQSLNFAIAAEMFWSP